MIMNKEQVVKLIEEEKAGNIKEVYCTSAENKNNEVAEVVGCAVEAVEYVGQFDGENFEFENKEVVDGDMIYIIK
ncbi:hypothetical protein MFLO_15965 [Listeria floridensis FSL S10-1187]|uniref:Phage protein n=1 Tax=Listeria floridensis FSL S10-1187 TaxID=1265817 RepID=A0ABN0RB62_9LIST|nr:hypothetical protein [Listeria floridensis]EUJ23461.1 hypothetical protein MFLO_15965 [Listeria floridensis FSL S10-1187]